MATGGSRGGRAQEGRGGGFCLSGDSFSWGCDWLRRVRLSAAGAPAPREEETRGRTTQRRLGGGRHASLRLRRRGGGGRRPTRRRGRRGGGGGSGRGLGRGRARGRGRGRRLPRGLIGGAASPCARGRCRARRPLVLVRSNQAWKLPHSGRGGMRRRRREKALGGPTNEHWTLGHERGEGGRPNTRGTARTATSRAAARRTTKKGKREKGGNEKETTGARACGKERMRGLCVFLSSPPSFPLPSLLCPRTYRLPSLDTPLAAPGDVLCAAASFFFWSNLSRPLKHLIQTAPADIAPPAEPSHSQSQASSPTVAAAANCRCPSRERES